MYLRGGKQNYKNRMGKAYYPMRIRRAFHHLLPTSPGVQVVLFESLMGKLIIALIIVRFGFPSHVGLLITKIHIGESSSLHYTLLFTAPEEDAAVLYCSLSEDIPALWLKTGYKAKPWRLWELQSYHRSQQIDKIVSVSVYSIPKLTLA